MVGTQKSQVVQFVADLTGVGVSPKWRSKPGISEGSVANLHPLRAVDPEEVDHA